MTMPAEPQARPRRSTGPRTPQGKWRSARNARRHGLSGPIRADPAWRAEVLALERELAGEAPNRYRGTFARLAAEAVVELRRIARARAALLGDADQAGAAMRTLAAMRRLDRYEGLAYAKKQRAYAFLWVADTPGLQPSRTG